MDPIEENEREYVEAVLSDCNLFLEVLPYTTHALTEALNQKLGRAADHVLLNNIDGAKGLCEECLVEICQFCKSSLEKALVKADEITRARVVNKIPTTREVGPFTFSLLPGELAFLDILPEEVSKELQAALSKGADRDKYFQKIRDEMSEHTRGDSLDPDSISTWTFALLSTCLGFRVGARDFVQQLGRVARIVEDPDFRSEMASKLYEHVSEHTVWFKEFGKDVPVYVTDAGLLESNYFHYLGHPLTVVYSTQYGVYDVSFSGNTPNEAYGFKGSDLIVHERRTGIAEGEESALFYDGEEVRKYLEYLRSKKVLPPGIVGEEFTPPTHEELYASEHMCTFFGQVCERSIIVSNIRDVAFALSKLPNFKVAGESVLGFQLLNDNNDSTTSDAIDALGTDLPGPAVLALRLLARKGRGAEAFDGPLFALSIPKKIFTQGEVNKIRTELLEQLDGRLVEFTDSRFVVLFTEPIKLDSKGKKTIVGLQTYGTSRCVVPIIGPAFIRKSSTETTRRTKVPFTYRSVLTLERGVPLNTTPMQPRFDKRLAELGFKSVRISGEEVNCISNSRKMVFPFFRPTPEQLATPECQHLHPYRKLRQRDYTQMVYTLLGEWVDNIIPTQMLSHGSERTRSRSTIADEERREKQRRAFEIRAKLKDENRLRMPKAVIGEGGFWYMWKCKLGADIYYRVEGPDSAVYLFDSVELADKIVHRFASGGGRLETTNLKGFIARKLYVEETTTLQSRVDESIRAYFEELRRRETEGGG